MVIEKIPYIQDIDIYKRVLVVVGKYMEITNNPIELYENLLNLYSTDYNTFIQIEQHLQTVFK